MLIRGKDNLQQQPISFRRQLRLGKQAYLDEKDKAKSKCQDTLIIVLSELLLRRSYSEYRLDWRLLSVRRLSIRWREFASGVGQEP